MKSFRLKRVSLSYDLKRASRSNHARIYTKTAQLYRVYHHRQRNKAITKKHVSLPFRGSFLEACNVCARRCVKSNRGRKGTKRKETKGNERKRSAADIHRRRKRCSIHETKSAVIGYTVIPLRVFTIVLIVIAISHGARVTGIGLMLSLSVIWPRYRRSSSLGDVSDRRGDVPVPSSPPVTRL